MTEKATDEQLAVAYAPLDAHIKVVAVPGSGKSTTMRLRVATLLKAQIPPSQILVMMFNKAAQLEFDHKLKALYPGCKLPQTRTFHSLGFRLCESLAKSGLLPPYKLNNSTNGQIVLAKEALKKIVGSHPGGQCNPNEPGVTEQFISYIDLVKSGLLTPDVVFDQSGIDKKLSLFIEAFNIFEELRRNKRERFFSDLIYDPIQLILKSNQAMSFVTNRLGQVIVDEYQDINSISQEMIRILAGDRAFVTAVGDDDQTLYGFRGSKPEYLIKQFDSDFKNPLVFTLSKTFRYGHAISLASNNLIINNRDRVNKQCISSDSAPKSIIELKLEQAEPGGESTNLDQQSVISPIESWLVNGRKLREIAILLRVFSFAPTIELALLRQGIPYRIEGCLSVFELPEISALIDLLKIANKTFLTSDKTAVAESIYRILLLPHPGISQHIIDELSKEIANNFSDLKNAVALVAARQPAFIGSRLNRKADAICYLRDTPNLTPFEALFTYLEMTECKKGIISMSMKSEDADTLVSAIDAFVDFCKSKNLSTSELITQIESLRSAQRGNKGAIDAVTITSVHRSKGLEWPMVILPRLSETCFPYIRDEDDVDIQSERRLFYVAMTRAIEHLVLIIPNDDQYLKSLQHRSSKVPIGLYGNKERASRFIYEANLRPCIEVGKAIHDNAGYLELDPLTEIELFNQYLAKTGAQFRLSKSQ